MAWRWVVGPPGSGRTGAAVAAARAAAAAGRRVAWIGLPTQRDHALRRLAAAGPLLGVAFLTLQQLALLQLGRAGRLRPQVLGTARLALVAEALAERAGVLPSPGEASLFARAIGEARRHGLGPDEQAALAETLARAGDPGAAEVARLADVHARYRRLKAEAWDDDDVRAAAWEEAAGAAAADLRAALPGDLLVVDGFRELAPGDLAWLARLAEVVEVVLTADDAAPDVDDGLVTRLPARPAQVEAWRFANPVAEVRWVLRSLARDLADGLDPRDVAVVAPPAAARALAVLANEFGVVLADERPRSLTDLPYGRLLADLLELPEHPTAGRLLAVPALAELGRAALAAGLAGRDAIGRLADEIGAAGAWTDWLAALTPGPAALPWARQLVALAADLLAADGTSPMPGGEPPAVVAASRAWAADLARAQEAALRRAQEAARLGSGDGFRAWWLALLRASSLRERPRPGVALLEPARASGRRFRRVYLVGAVAGAYDVGEREDAFVPEEARVAAADAGAGRLPRRHRGRDAAWREELRRRGDLVTITHADADRGGPLRPDALLLGAPHGAAAPEVPTASRVEATAGPPFAPAAGERAPAAAPLETLRLAQDCAFRAWAAPLVEGDPRAAWVGRARRALVQGGAWSDRREAELARAFPPLAPWLARHRAALARLRFGVALAGPGFEARLDAVERDGDRVTIVRFALPGEPPAAAVRPDLRWTELWAADALRRRTRDAPARVDVAAWTLGGERVLLTPDGVDAGAFVARRARVRGLASEAAVRWAAGPPRPAPGHRCRDCPVADLCRPEEGHA